MGETFKAIWNVTLYATCPECKERVDLLDHPDFWDGNGSLKLCEHGTDRSRGMEVCCPECAALFTVDLEY